MGHLCLRHRELDVRVLGQLRGDLVERREAHAADERVGGVGACAGTSNAVSELVTTDHKRTILQSTSNVWKFTRASTVFGQLMSKVKSKVHRAQRNVTHQVRTLALLGQARHPPHDGAMLVLVLGLAGGDLEQGLLQGVHGSQEPFDTLHFAGPERDDAVNVGRSAATSESWSVGRSTFNASDLIDSVSPYNVLDQQS